MEGAQTMRVARAAETMMVARDGGCEVAGGHRPFAVAVVVVV